MKLTLSTRIVDRGAAKLRATIKQLSSQPSVKVGVVGAKADEDHGGIPMGELAAVHEYGSPKQNIPERSFIRSTMDAHKAEVAGLLGKGLGNLLDGHTTASLVLYDLGGKMAAEVRGRIESGLSPALKTPTHKPLDDTGALKEAIGFEVAVDGRVPR